MEIDELFNKYGSDKTRNGYAPPYHALFKNLRDRPITFLEIGIGTMIPGVHSSMANYALSGYAPGGSLRAWRDYFPNGDIHGVDIQPDTQFCDDRITTHLCNSADAAAVEQLLESDNFPKQFDVVLDDGSHWDVNQLNTFKNLYKLVKPGGYYIIEDVIQNSRIFTEFLPVIREFANDGFVYGVLLTDHLHLRNPILVISKK